MPMPMGVAARRVGIHHPCCMELPNLHLHEFRVGSPINRGGKKDAAKQIHSHHVSESCMHNAATSPAMATPLPAPCHAMPCTELLIGSSKAYSNANPNNPACDVASLSSYTYITPFLLLLCQILKFQFHRAACLACFLHAKKE